MDGWVWAVSFYHLWSCDRSHSINPREQYCQEKHNDLIKNSILQLNPLTNCSLKAGFWRGVKSTVSKVSISAYHLENISFGFTFTEVLEDRMASYWPWYEPGRSQDKPLGRGGRCFCAGQYILKCRGVKCFHIYNVFSNSSAKVKQNDRAEG